MPQRYHQHNWAKSAALCQLRVRVSETAPTLGSQSYERAMWSMETTCRQEMHNIITARYAIVEADFTQFIYAFRSISIHTTLFTLSLTALNLLVPQILSTTDCFSINWTDFIDFWPCTNWFLLLLPFQLIFRFHLSLQTKLIDQVFKTYNIRDALLYHVKKLFLRLHWLAKWVTIFASIVGVFSTWWMHIIHRSISQAAR